LKSLSIFFKSATFSLSMKSEEKLYNNQVNAKTIPTININAYQGLIINAWKIIPISLIKSGDGGNQTNMNSDITNSIEEIFIYLDIFFILSYWPVWVYNNIFHADINAAVFINECPIICNIENIGTQRAQENAIIHIFSLLE